MLATSIKVSWSGASKPAHAIPDSASTVAAILAKPDDAHFDYAAAKLAFDKLIDDSTDTSATLSPIETMAATARQLALG